MIFGQIPNVYEGRVYRISSGAGGRRSKMVPALWPMKQMEGQNC